MDTVPMVADRREATLALGWWLVLVGGGILWTVLLGSVGGFVDFAALLVIVTAAYGVWLAYVDRLCGRIGVPFSGGLKARIAAREKEARRLRIGFVRSFGPAVRTLVTGRPAGSVNLTPR